MEAPRIVQSDQQRLVGMRIRTNMAADQTYELWHAFKPRVKEIQNRLNNDFYSVQKFENDIHFSQVTPFTQFEKWAAVEVKDNGEMIPPGLEPLVIPGGKYAIFIHKGLAKDFSGSLKYIFGQWLPDSPFELDNRLHFEVMKENYSPNDPEAEEEIWIPLK